MPISKLILPKNYTSELSLIDTQVAIKLIKDTFENQLAENLKLIRVSAPLFVSQNSGLNDNLSGIERPVHFDIKEVNDEFEIVHSLAKWKRMALKKYEFKNGEGLYTDMNAIRRDEDLDNLHSIYVDQWDWEKIISNEERTVKTLKNTVRAIMKTVKETENILIDRFPSIKPFIEENIKFITTQELEDKYPNLTPKERENAICKEFESVFIMQIGDVLESGKKHDGRAPDYDDWSLNGDILIYDHVLDQAMEISSMGIRVNKNVLLEQLQKANCLERTSLPFHSMLLSDQLPLTMGGGIGQSRLCMLLLHKAHIGEVQASAWSKEMFEICKSNNIHLL